MSRRTHAPWVIAWALNNASGRARGVCRRRSGVGRHASSSGRRRARSGRNRAHRATTTGRARRTRGPARAASSSAPQPNTPTFSPRRGRTARRRGSTAFVTHERPPIPARPDAGVDAAPPSPRVVIIGAGFGGLAAAVALRRRGIDDLTIIERADGVGGTWRQNIYPGCGVRHPEPPVLVLVRAEPGVEPHLRLSAGDPRLPGVGRRRLRPPPAPDARHAACAACDGTRQRRTGRSSWTDGDTVVADVVVSAVGLFGAARYPDIDGLADFSGTLMHTAQWDASVDLTGKRVAVIGTGASGVQVVPELPMSQRR